MKAAIESTQKTILTFYVLESLFVLSLNTIHATNILFMLSKGLDLLQVNLVNMFYMGSVFLLEIPTGALSDIFGRKRSFLVSCLFLSLSFFIYYSSGSFLYFAFAEVIAAIGMTFHSGALEAWFVDSLDRNGYTKKKDKLFGRTAMLSSVVSIIAGSGGAYLGSYNLALPFLAGALSALSTLVIAIMIMKEAHRIQDEKLSLGNGISRVRNIMKFSVIYGIKNRTVLLLIIPGAISMFSFMALMQYWQPYFEDLSGNVQSLGYAWIGLSMGTMLGGILVQWTSALKRYIVLILSVGVCATTLIGMTQSSHFVGSLVLFLSYFVGRGIMLPTRRAYINDYIPADARATILSFDSMICRGAASIGLVVFGLVAKSASIISSWYLASLVILLALLPLLLLRTVKAENFLSR